jgi:Tfp pilus assembly protein PilE
MPVRSERGATLIELIVTIVLLGLMAVMLSVVAFSLFGEGGASPNINVQAQNIAGTVEEQFLAAPYGTKKNNYGCSTQGVTMPSGFTASVVSPASTAAALSVRKDEIVSCVVSVYHDGNIATTLGAYKTDYRTIASGGNNNGNNGQSGKKGNNGKNRNRPPQPPFP